MALLGHTELMEAPEISYEVYLDTTWWRHQMEAFSA